MKHIILCGSLFLLCILSKAQIATTRDTLLLDPVELISVRAAETAPVAKTTLSKKEIEKNNIGQDLPFILNQTTSVVAHSDAGNGVGYTGIRIRGTDASRINVTLNSIPYNDAESQQTFFVDLPDFASSANSIQIQRGVGTSTNGAGSFGGTININTNEVQTKQGLEFNSSAGSYHTIKNTLMLNSGLLADHITIDGRLSNIRSDGYIDRASSRLKSFYASVAYIDQNSSVRANVFSGKEKTYQAWYGIREDILRDNRSYNSAGTEKPGDPYDNETDNYLQTHYQIFFNHKFSSHWKAGLAGFLTRGNGYYEQYKSNQALSDYGLPDYDADTAIITETDMIRRLWLDNNFYGTIFSIQYNKGRTNILAGGGWNQYEGRHYGQVIRAKVQAAVPANHIWYDHDAAKRDISGYIKWTRQIKNWQVYADMQVRSVDYEINGFRYNPTLFVNNNYFFVNPKGGVTYTRRKFIAYASFARASKEPNRDDFESATMPPLAEKLNDFEVGAEWKDSVSHYGVNLYYMSYSDQLVLTGKINDVGAYARTNIPESYRAGIEMRGYRKICNWLSLNMNLTLSENKIRNFTEYLDDYDNGGQQTKFYNKTNISFSPGITGSAALVVTPVKNGTISFISKYVGKQFLDNASNELRKLDPYFVQDIRLDYEWPKPRIRGVNFFFQVNNLFSEKYEPNGYSFSYYYNYQLTTENYYYPMAPINWMLGLSIKL